MAEFSQQDHDFMQLALTLAEKGRYTATPNPAVGCVLVKNGKIVGAGFHAKAGQPHAERIALAQAGAQAKGATAYVTLEPCAHYGRTPPCTLGLIDAGVVKVIAAMSDPNPQVAGKGFHMLSKAGITCRVGLLADSAAALNKGFFTRMRTGMPLVRLKLAMSLDGRTAMASGESKWITGASARVDVQKERSKSCAILSTAATVLADDPSLTVRREELPEAVLQVYPQPELRQPIRIILDSQNRVQPQYKLFETVAPIWLVGTQKRDMHRFPSHCEQILLPEGFYFSMLLRELGLRQINSLWVEAGANLAGSLVEQKVVDELILYMAPKLLGDSARGLCHLPHLTRLADAPQWECTNMSRIGDDLKLVYQPIKE